GLIEFGRGPERTGVRRISLDDQHASRDHLRAEELADGRLRLENLSQRLPVIVGSEKQLAAGATYEAPLPLEVTLGRTTVSTRAHGASDPQGHLAGLLTIPPPTAVASRLNGSFLPAVMERGEAPSADRLVQWMETALTLQRSSASPSELFQQTTQAMVDLI